MELEGAQGSVSGGAWQVSDLMLPVTFYRCLRDVQPHPRVLQWMDLVRELRTYRDAAGTKEDRAHTCPLWSPVELQPGITRSSKAVEQVAALVLDYDDDAELGASMDCWPGLERVGYTTWSHTSAAPRCRVVLPLAVPIAGQVWSAVYARTLEQAGLTADPQCKDAARVFFLPAQGAGGPHRSTYAKGQLLDLCPVVDAVVAEQAEQEQEKRRRLAELKQVLHTTRDMERAARDALIHDPSARLALAERVGARVVEASGRRAARGAPCPCCGRPDVWWLVDGTGWAKCNHQQSCGWEGSLYDYGKGT